MRDVIEGQTVGPVGESEGRRGAGRVSQVGASRTPPVAQPPLAPHQLPGCGQTEFRVDASKLTPVLAPHHGPGRGRLPPEEKRKGGRRREFWAH